MTGKIRELPPIDIPGHEASVSADANHPMRVVTRRAAGLDGDPWDEPTRRVVESLFDGLAPEWHRRVSPERSAVVVDALERGIGARQHGVAVEVGSGIGTYTGLLAAWWDTVVAVDLSVEMLKLSPPRPGHRVQADASHLPLDDGVAASVVLVNALLFPAEVDRVLAADGVVLWVNSSGDQTPIHLAPGEVAGALPGGWEGVSARAGIGLWCALRRAA